MNPNQALWEKGDFTRIVASMRSSGEALVDRLGITEGLEVLDLGCGDGTTAVPAARRRQRVGVDIAGNLVDAGNKRAVDEGLDNLRFQQGDVCKRPTWPTTTSTSSSRSSGDVRALPVRCRQGDGAGDPTWRADRHGKLDPRRPDPRRADPQHQLCLPPPPPQPDDWDVVDDVVERFTAAGIPASKIVRARHVRVRGAGVPTVYLTWFRDYYGPTMTASRPRTSNGRADDLFAQLDALFNAQNTSGDPNTTAIPATFLSVSVTKTLP